MVRFSASVKVTPLPEPSQAGLVRLSQLVPVTLPVVKPSKSRRMVWLAVGLLCSWKVWFTSMLPPAMAHSCEASRTSRRSRHSRDRRARDEREPARERAKRRNTDMRRTPGAKWEKANSPTSHSTARGQGRAPGRGHRVNHGSSTVNAGERTGLLTIYRAMDREG